MKYLANAGQGNIVELDSKNEHGAKIEASKWAGYGNYVSLQVDTGDCLELVCVKYAGDKKWTYGPC